MGHLQRAVAPTHGPCRTMATTCTNNVDNVDVQQEATKTMLEQQQQLEVPSSPQRDLLLVKALRTCSDTASETSTRSSLSFASSTSSTRSWYDEHDSTTKVVQQQQQQNDDHDQTVLVLPHFVQRYSRHDVYQLRDALLREDCPFKTICIDDVADPTNLRRFAYKKDNVTHHLQRICQQRHVHFEYRVTLHLNADQLSVDSILSLLSQVKKIPEIRTLQVSGRFTHSQLDQVLKTLTSLVRLDDRDWIQIQLAIGFLVNDKDTTTSSRDQQYQAWRGVMEHYMEVFSQLYTKYHLPIDIQSL